ncbi:MAG: biopolymer transporter ExbD [Planctomycetota bacterium]
MRALRRRDAAFIREQVTGPSMTPMVDVTLVILIFFMATATVAGREWLFPVTPEAPTEAAPEPAPSGLGVPSPIIELSLSVVDGQTVCSGAQLRAITIENLAGALGRVLAGVDTSSLTFVIVPEDGVPYEAVVRARAAVKTAGVETVGLR